jgi:hypothetical protein
MPILANITQCKVSNRKPTFVWHVRWLFLEPLATAFPALFSHHTQHNSSVHEVPLNEINWGIRDRLTNAATNQLAFLSSFMQDVTLLEQHDQRLLLDDAPFDTKGAYKNTHVEHI